MARKPNPNIAQLGPISDAIRALGEERRAERDAITMEVNQYEAGRQRAAVVESTFQTSTTKLSREEYFAMELNRPLRTDGAWFIRGYWAWAAECFSNTPENFIRY